MSLAYYKTDKALEVEGKWFEFSGGMKVKLARIGHKDYEELKDKLTRPYRKMIQAGGRIPREKETDIMNTVLSQECIRDWEGMKDPETGEEIKYTAEAAKKILAEYEDFANEVVFYASQLDSYRSEATKEAAKN